MRGTTRAIILFGAVLYCFVLGGAAVAGFEDGNKLFRDLWVPKIHAALRR
jgi:hypothetical protein